VTASTLAAKWLGYFHGTLRRSCMNLLGSVMTAGCVLLFCACKSDGKPTPTPGSATSATTGKLPVDPTFCATLPLRGDSCHLCGPAARSFLKVPEVSCDECTVWANQNGCTPHCSSNICNIECPPILECPEWSETRCNPCAGGPGGVWTPSGCDGTVCANSAPRGCSGHCVSSKCRLTCP
jgi:hypothetical protein